MSIDQAVGDAATALTAYSLASGATVGPGDYGWKAWAYDPAMCYQGTPPSAGVLILQWVPIRVPTTITNVILNIASAGTGLTSGQNFAGLFQDGKLLAATASQSTAWASGGTKVAALTTPQPVKAGGVYVGFFANGTGVPQFSRSIVTAGANDFTGSGFKRCGAANSGLTTAMPATLGAITELAHVFWAAVS